MSEALCQIRSSTTRNWAREWLEGQIWAHGRFCPHCGVVDQSTLMQGKTTRPGLYQCNACREPFTVTVGTLYERSKIPLHKWLAATHLLMAGKKGISALEIGRMLSISKKSSWFLMHRIRESLPPKALTPMGTDGKVQLRAMRRTSAGRKRTSTATSARPLSAAWAKRSSIRLWSAKGMSARNTFRQ